MSSTLHYCSHRTYIMSGHAVCFPIGDGRGMVLDSWQFLPTRGGENVMVHARHIRFRTIINPLCFVHDAACHHMVQWPRIGVPAEKQMRRDGNNMNALFLKTNNHSFLTRTCEDYPFEETMTSLALPEESIELETMCPLASLAIPDIL